MGAESKIEWTSHTFNPWVGCSKVSPGCEHCYAESWAKRSGLVQWGPHHRRRTSAATWRQPVRWNRDAEALESRPRVFCASLADVFDDAVLAQWRTDLWDLIAQTPGLDWLLVTKRVGNVAAMVPSGWLAGGWPVNVWLGITVTHQDEADRDIPRLLELPAPVRFLSCEPLLGALDLRRWLWCQLSIDEIPGYALDEGCTSGIELLSGIDWIIVGGESGPRARPLDPQWVRALRDQAHTAGKAFFFKQWGEWVHADQSEDAFVRVRLPKLHQFDDGTLVGRVGKKTAGRVLDGRTWDQIPPSPAAGRSAQTEREIGSHRALRSRGEAELGGDAAREGDTQ